MMKIYNVIAVVILCSSLASAQNIELVVDFNPGPENGFSEWEHEAAYLGDDLIISAINENGHEIGILSDGQLSILKDINPDEGGSQPEYLINYKDVVYFAAEEEGGNNTLWKTDGTEAGTVQVVDPGDSAWSSVGRMTIAKNGWMYYNYSSALYRTDGEVHELLSEEDSFLDDSNNQASPTFCTYKDGLAYLVENNDNSYSVFYAEEGEPQEITRSEMVAGFSDVYGLLSVKGGLMFNIDDSDIDGIYVYQESDQSLNRLTIENETNGTVRSVNFNEEYNLALIRDQGFYLVNGQNNEEIFLSELLEIPGVSGESMQSHTHKDHAIFIGSEGFFGDDFLVYTDGTTDGTRNLLTLQPHSSDIIGYGQYAFFADGTSNGFEPIIYQINMVTGEVDEIFEFGDDIAFSAQIEMIAVQNEKLYFISAHDSEVGLELYSLDLDIDTNIFETENNELDYSIIQGDNTIEIQMDEILDLQLSIYNTTGKLILKENTHSNRPTKLNVPTGMYHVHIKTKDNYSTQSLFFNSK